MKLSISYKPLGSLEPYAHNARTHSDAQVMQIAGSIRRFGFVNPVLLGEDGVIIAGHGRVLAARKLGLAEVPTIVIKGLSEQQRHALALADNRIALNSGWDAELLRSELQAISEGGEDIGGLGFEDKELAALFDDDDAGIHVEEVATAEVSDRFWISVRGPLKDQAEALQRLQRAMEGLADVDVELGTIAVEP